MSISNIPVQGVPNPPWLQPGGQHNSKTLASISASDTSSSSSTASAGAGSSISFQQLGKDLQGFLLQLQSGAGAASASRGGAARVSPSQGDQDGDNDGGSGGSGASGASQTPGHHQHRHLDLQETGSGDQSGSLASAGTTQPGSGTTSSGAPAGISLLTALKSYTASSNEAQQQTTLTRSA